MRAKRPLVLPLLGLCAFLGTSAADSQPAPSDAGLDLGEAILLTLENDPNIALVEARLAGARGALLGAAGKFDPVLTSRVDQETSDIPRSETTSTEVRSLTSSLDLATLLRSGLSITPSLDISRIHAPGAGDTAPNLG